MTEIFNPIRAAHGGYDQQAESASCEQHGPYSQAVYFEQGVEVGRRPDRCPACAEEEERLRKEEQAKQERQRRLQERLDAAGLVERFSNAGFEEYDPSQNREAFESIRAYAGRWPAQCKTGESLLLLGSIGTGKTHLAIALLRHIIHWGSRGFYCTVRELVRDIRNTWGQYGEGKEEQLLGSYARVDLLVLDEAGAQFGSDSERLIVFEVINRRYENLLPTVIVGNATLEELERCLDPRTVDRLRENGGKALVFKGGSRRRAA